MTQEEKQLLLKDLCARLPYGVVIHTDWKDVKLDRDHCGIGMLYYEHYSEEAKKECGYDENDCSIIISGCYYGDIKPYLRPMSSMTEEEENEYRAINCYEGLFPRNEDALDYVLEHHFDYRGLIEKGLALESPEGMYKEEESEKESEIPVPKTIDEAISTLEKILSDEDREYLLKNGAISMHDSLGRWIRNEWGLWTNSKLKNELKKKGFEHPDDMSNYIIEEFIKYWNNKI